MVLLNGLEKKEGGYMPETTLENDSGLSPSLPRGHNIIGPKKTVYPFPAGSRAGHLAGGHVGQIINPSRS